MLIKIKKIIWSIIYLFSHIIFLNKKISRGNNSLTIDKVLFYKSRIFIQGKNNTVIIGKNTRISNLLIYIIGDNNIVKVGSKCILRGKKIHVEGSGCEVSIGDKTTIESAELACTEIGKKITIGTDCMFADDIDIRNGDSHSIIDLDSGKRTNFAKDINIGDHVWIASHSIILKGVSIASDSVVASGSIVTKNVLANSVVGGVPSSVIKKRITWSRERILI